MITKGFMKVFPVIGFGFVVAVIDLIISLIISPGRPSFFMATIDFSVLFSLDQFTDTRQCNLNFA